MDVGPLQRPIVASCLTSEVRVMPETDNSDQIAYWNADAGENWASLQKYMDAQLEPYGSRAMEALALAPGERVLDVGCGSGQTSLALGQAVGAGGTVVGVDISRPLLDVARRRAADVGAAQVSFVEADAQTYAFAAAGFEAVFSRFGVMFFADPPAAFANIRRALKPAGRLAFVCWRTPAENAMMTVPHMAAAAHLPPSPPPTPGAPGPFAFADPARVRDILSSAGFGDIDLTPYDRKVGGGDLEQTLAVSLSMGMLGRALLEHPDKRAMVIDDVREALRPHVDEDGIVRLGSAAWIVTARA
jgi:ubiquinone/menaquinone biosynthesis C-methylase UbiE